MGLLDRLFRRKKPEPVSDPWDGPLVKEIAVAMLRQIPEDWDRATLVLEPTEKGLGTGMRHSAITRTPGNDFSLKDGDFVTPNAAVLAATRRFELAWVERASTFKRVTIDAERVAGNWNVQSRNEYND